LVLLLLHLIASGEQVGAAAAASYTFCSNGCKYQSVCMQLRSSSAAVIKAFGAILHSMVLVIRHVTIVPQPLTAAQPWKLTCLGLPAYRLLGVK
jgi:hypothetical protein